MNRTFAVVLFISFSMLDMVCARFESPAAICLIGNDGGLCLPSISNATVFLPASVSGTFADGSIFSDPFGEGGGAVRAAQMFIYNGKLYIGPNAAETAVFEMSFDLATSATVTIDGDGTAGAPYTSFSGLPNASGSNLVGIDSFYSGCTAASPATLTGAACTGAGGTEANFIGGFNLGGSLESIWRTPDLAGPLTYTQTAGLESGGKSFRGTTMGIFKDQLYVSQADSGGGAVKFSRICVNPVGCANGDAFNAVTKLGGAFLNHIGKSGAFGNGAVGLVSIDSMWEYDNDGAGTNASQLYIASGGQAAGLPSTAGKTTDGGILRTSLLVSTAGFAPINCPSVFFCGIDWNDVTPTNAKWLSHMSIALPDDPSAGGDWDALIPANKLTPAIKAIPAMRTAPNGDLYLIRNACANAIVRSVANGNFVANGRNTCTAGNEVPQLWMLPQGTTAVPSTAGDWVLVAEAGGTGRTDMSGNASCVSGVNLCDVENTHITLLEFSGNFLYIGYDNATYGLNVWRVDMTAIVSGTAPAESAFALVGSFGLGDAVNQRRIFADAIANASGTDLLYILTGNGTNALSIFRTDNS